MRDPLEQKILDHVTAHPGRKIQDLANAIDAPADVRALAMLTMINRGELVLTADRKIELP